MKKMISTLVAGLMILSSVDVGYASTITFTDVAPQSPYAPYINELVQLNVLHGIGDGTFSPTSPVTRAQFAIMLAIAFHLETTSKNPFTDVTPDGGEIQIMEAYEAGLIAGETPTTFHPNGYVTREQAATMVWRFVRNHNTPSVVPAGSMQLQNTDEWASDAVKQVVANGFYGQNEVTTDKDTGIVDYGSKRFMTRQEAAALIDLTLQKTQLIINPNSNPHNMGVLSEGTYIPANMQMPKSISENQSRVELTSNMETLGSTCMTFSGDEIQLEFPGLGNPDLHFIVKDETGYEWEGREPKTITLSSKNIEVSVVKPSTGKVLAKMNIVNESGQWDILYPQE